MLSILRAFRDVRAAEQEAKVAKKTARKSSAKKSSARKSSGSSKRTTVDTGTTKMFAKRTSRGQFKEMDDVGRSLTTDRRQAAKKSTKSGYGDQGDRKTSSKKR